MDIALQLFKIWAPIIVIIAVWFLFMRRLGVGGSFQKTVLEEMKVQTKEQAEIARHLDRIATALEQRQP